MDKGVYITVGRYNSSSHRLMRGGTIKMGYAMGIKQINGMFFPLIGQSPAQTGGFNGDSNALSNAFDQSNDNQFGDQLQTGMMLTMMMAMMSMIGMLMQLMTMLMGMLNGQNATGGGNNGFNLLNGGGPGGGNFFNPAGGPGGTMMLSNPGASGSGGFPGVAGGPGVSGTGPQTSVSSSPVATSFQVDPNAPVDAKRQSLINLAQQHIGQSESQFLGQYGGHAGAWCGFRVYYAKKHYGFTIRPSGIGAKHLQLGPAKRPSDQHAQTGRSDNVQLVGAGHQRLVAAGPHRHC
jgi:hypothetical protein